MDQEIIQSLEAKYRSLAVKKQIAALEKENKTLTLSILTAMFMLTEVWNSIPEQTFINCFKKSIILLEVVKKHINVNNNPFCGLEVEEAVMENSKGDLELLKAKFDADFNLTIDELVNINFDVCIAKISSYDNIIAEVSRHDAIETEQKSDDECVDVFDDATKPSLNKAVHAITVLENYSLCSNFAENLTKALKDKNCVVDIDLQSHKRQYTNTDFFFENVNV
ncbi:uncharacterized protein LOC124807794 [Hydra vulgaris]|uniref:uncharacterized protein LOC124807794 n=1 Tax=Hydra vulgaris TaxID=6087 RepID=UPI001F5F89E8|nr:uncharacterized protein LOC124807794 [Hydra vulgaris]